MTKKQTAAEIGLDNAAAAQARAKVVFRLYVVGTTPNSTRAVVNTRAFCERYLKGRYDLEVIDLSRQPARAASDQIVAAPTLIRKSPLPERRFIGDLSQIDRLLHELTLQKL